MGLSPPCAKPRRTRIRTSGNFAFHEGLYDDVGGWGVLDENTRSGAIDASCLFAREIVRNLEHEDMTEDLTEILTTSAVDVEYRVETSAHVR